MGVLGLLDGRQLLEPHLRHEWGPNASERIPELLLIRALLGVAHRVEITGKGEMAEVLHG